MALVLALGALGVGYALWWDEVTIVGTVHTGNVEISIEGLSETWVYKDLDTSEIVMSPVELVAAHLMYVASATAVDVTAQQADGAKTVEMTFDNIFPTADPIVADVLLHYTGSIPVHIHYTESFTGDDLSPYLVQQWFILNAAGEWVETEMLDIQLHYCDLVWLYVYLDGEALQAAGERAQGLSGTFTKTIFAYQWNGDPTGYFD